jgi:electron transfer flavoprotein beta subunit
MVPGILGTILGYNFINAVIGMEITDGTATVAREIDGGKEILEASLPLVVGSQKGIVQDDDLRIPNMRGIMMARKKPLSVVEPISADAKTEAQSFEKPALKSACKMVESVEELVDLLHNEAKVI